MSDKRLNGLNVAIFVIDGFEQSELTGPRETLDAAGAETEVPQEITDAYWGD